MIADDIDQPLKPLESIFHPDPLVTYSLSDSHALISRIVLNQETPVEVRQLFETAKNVSLYSWFNRHFHPVAELVAFSALEVALRHRNKIEDAGSAAKNSNLMLKNLLDKAITRGWLREETIENRMGIARARIHERQVYAAIEASKDKKDIDKDIEIPEPTDEEIKAEAESMVILPQLIKAASELRNHLAHGGPLPYWGSFGLLRSTAGLINQLFPRGE